MKHNKHAIILGGSSEGGGRDTYVSQKDPVHCVACHPVRLFLLAFFPRRFPPFPSRPVGWCRVYTISGPVVSLDSSLSASLLFVLVPRGHEPLSSLQHPRVKNQLPRVLLFGHPKNTPQHHIPLSECEFLFFYVVVLQLVYGIPPQ